MANKKRASQSNHFLPRQPRRAIIFTVAPSVRRSWPVAHTVRTMALFAGKNPLVDLVDRLVTDQPWYVAVPCLAAAFAATVWVVIWWNRDRSPKKPTG